MAGKLRSLFHAIFSAPTSEPAEPSTPALTASDIGFAVGASGGSIYEAAQLQYVLSCVVPPGEKPTSEQVAQAVGMLGGGVQEAVIIETLLKNK